MKTITIQSTDLYLDGKPLILPKMDWENFEDFCSICAEHLHAEGRAVCAVYVDGHPVDCTDMPSDGKFLSAKKIEVTSCLLNELISSALQLQQKICDTLVQDMMELSTDCLLQLPQETFADWKENLESLKSLVAFIPKFLSIQPLLSDAQIELTEKDLGQRIQEIQDAVDVCRKALEAQDVVLFSDTLETRIVSWLKAHKEMAVKLAERK